MRAGQFIIDPDTGGAVHPFAWLLSIGGLAHAAVERVVQVDWTGDGTSDRDINMGIAPDFVIVVSLDDIGSATDHLSLAYAISAAFGIFYNNGALQKLFNHTGTAGNSRWRGIQAGTNNIRTGNGGNLQTGVNFVGNLYRAIGFKFRDYP